MRGRTCRCIKVRQEVKATAGALRREQVGRQAASFSGATWRTFGKVGWPVAVCTAPWVNHGAGALGLPDKGCNLRTKVT